MIQISAGFFYHGINYLERQFKEDGYISGPKYCKTLQPEAKGGFKVQGYKPWLLFNDSFVWYDLPKVSTHAWESCKKICSVNRNCTSFDYCFQEENHFNEIFNCNMKGNTFAESMLKALDHCVQPVKQNCSVISE